MHFQTTAEKPAHRTFGLSEPDRDHDTVVQECLPTLLDEHGALPLGALCLLADTTLGSFVTPRLPADERMVTSHLHVELVRPLRPGLERVVGGFSGVELVPGSAFSTGRAVIDGDGAASSTRSGTRSAHTLLARFSGRFALVGGQQAGGDVSDAVPAPAVSVDAQQHPWTTAPIHQRLGTQIVAVTDGRVEVTVRASAELANERAGLHGGAGAAIGERTGDLALRSAVGDDAGFRPVELRVVFLRPVAASGGELTADAEVGFLGRTTATTTARLYRPDGKVAVQVDAVHVR